MITHLPDDNTIHTVLSLATRAPSIDDTQPWRWRVGAEGLQLYVDLGGRDADTEAASRDVLLSCGASLHHCVAALAALGWRAKVERFPDATDPEHLATVALYRHPAGALDVTLAAAIPRRRSDFRPYSAWPVSAVDLALIGARAARVGVTARRVESLPDLQDAVARACWRHAADYDHAGQSTNGSGGHTRFGGASRSRQQKSEPNLVMVVPPFAESIVTRPPGVTAHDNAIVLAMGTHDDSPVAWLRAGEAMSLMLLSATALGLVSAPIAEPLACPEIRDALQAALSDVIGYPQMLVRIGWPPVDADPLPSPPRRPLADVCEWLDRGSLTTA